MLLFFHKLKCCHTRFIIMFVIISCWKISLFISCIEVLLSYLYIFCVYDFVWWVKILLLTCTSLQVRYNNLPVVLMACYLLTTPTNQSTCTNKNGYRYCASTMKWFILYISPNFVNDLWDSFRLSLMHCLDNVGMTFPGHNWFSLWVEGNMV